MSDLFEQLDSYGAQLEASVDAFDSSGFDQQQRAGTPLPWVRILGVAASLVLIAGLIVWSQRGDDEAQSIDVIDQPQVPTVVATPDRAETQDRLPTDETAGEAEPDQPATPDTCTELNPALSGLVKGRPAHRLAIGDIESEVGTLPTEIAAGTYESAALGVGLTFTHDECVTLIEENPGMLTFVPAGEPFDSKSPWLSVLVPSAVSSTGGPSFLDTIAPPDDIGQWASEVDPVNATRLGEINIGGITGTEWLLEVNETSADTFACSVGSCASVVRPQATWTGTLRLHRPSFIHIGTRNQSRVIELMVDATPVWIWREAPADDEEFFTKTGRWLDGWTLQPGVEVDSTATFGPAAIGPLMAASGATIVIPAEDWSS